MSRLFHGTRLSRLNGIKKHGLLPGSRVPSHLATFSDLSRQEAVYAATTAPEAQEWALRAMQWGIGDEVVVLCFAAESMGRDRNDSSLRHPDLCVEVAPIPAALLHVHAKGDSEHHRCSPLTGSEADL